MANRPVAKLWPSLAEDDPVSEQAVRSAGAPPPSRSKLVVEGRFWLTIRVSDGEGYFKT